MNLTELWAEIEEELGWRVDELRFLNNQIELLQFEEEKEKLRRPVLLMIYAHFEGFSKFAFNLYITAINSEDLECREVNSVILASSFTEIFKDLRNPNSKSDVFRSTLPDEKKLHRFARSVHFLDELNEKLGLKVKIPDSTIDTESNLKPAVMSKLLYSVGLDYNLFAVHSPSIHRLLHKRNKISHGESRAGIEKEEFTILYTLAIEIMKGIKSEIMVCLTEKKYLKVA